MPGPALKNGRQQIESHSDLAAAQFPWQPAVSLVTPHPLLFLLTNFPFGSRLTLG